MNEERLQQLLKLLKETKIPYINYQGKRDGETNLVSKDGNLVLEQLIRAFFLDTRDSELGVLQAKVFMYEQIISKSNFAPMIKEKEYENPLRNEAGDSSTQN